MQDSNQQTINEIQINYDKTPIAIFLLGTNGSGKSSLRRYLNLSDIQTNIDPDVLNRIYKRVDPIKYEIKSAKRAIHLYNDAIEHNMNICIESTLSGKTTIERIKKAKNKCYHV